MYQTARRLGCKPRLQQMISLALVGTGLALCAAAAIAQAPRTLPAPANSGMAAPPPPGVTERAYDDLSWTGSRPPVAVARKEARAALSAGRRHCNRMRPGTDRQECLRVVQQDYEEMMARLKTR